MTETLWIEEEESLINQHSKKKGRNTPKTKKKTKNVKSKENNIKTNDDPISRYEVSGTNSKQETFLDDAVADANRLIRMTKFSDEVVRAKNVQHINIRKHLHQRNVLYRNLVKNNEIRNVLAFEDLNLPAREPKEKKLVGKRKFPHVKPKFLTQQKPAADGRRPSYSLSFVQSPRPKTKIGKKLHKTIKPKVFLSSPPKLEVEEKECTFTPNTKLSRKVKDVPSKFKDFLQSPRPLKNRKELVAEKKKLEEAKLMVNRPTPQVKVPKASKSKFSHVRSKVFDHLEKPTVNDEEDEEVMDDFEVSTIISAYSEDEPDVVIEQIDNHIIDVEEENIEQLI